MSVHKSRYGLPAPVPYDQLDGATRKIVDTVLASLSNKYDVPLAYTVLPGDFDTPDARNKACKAVVMGAVLVFPISGHVYLLAKASIFRGILKALGLSDAPIRTSSHPYIGYKNVYCPIFKPVGYNAYAIAFIPTEDQMKVILSGRRLADAHIP